VTGCVRSGEHNIPRPRGYIQLSSGSKRARHGVRQLRPAALSLLQWPSYLDVVYNIPPKTAHLHPLHDLRAGPNSYSHSGPASRSQPRPFIMKLSVPSLLIVTIIFQTARVAAVRYAGVNVSNSRLQRSHNIANSAKIRGLDWGCTSDGSCKQFGEVDLDRRASIR
jgi:hypothetical protein